MGGRGTFASGTVGKIFAYTYEKVGEIHGVKVLAGIKGAGRHGLPEEAHASTAYIKLKPDGTFHEMRIYDKNHYLTKEIAYHPEPNLNHGNRKENILHVHEYPQKDNFRLRPAHRITKKEYEQYKQFFKGVPDIDRW